jgi:glucosamine--fructose-6-phosphate aminotransferase (isomerizing)
VICEKEPERLIAARSGCPLVVGRTKQASYVASDVMAMLAHTRDVMYLEEGDVAVVTQHDVQVTDADGREVSRKTTRVTWDASAAEKSGYPHFMLKEINEQPQTILDTMRGRYSYDTGEADLADIGLTPTDLLAVDRIWIVACGTSWHAGLVGKYLLEEMVRTPVQVDIGSEFRYRDPLVGKNDLFITISQSGETGRYPRRRARSQRKRGARPVDRECRWQLAGAGIRWRALYALRAGDRGRVNQGVYGPVDRPVSVGAASRPRPQCDERGRRKSLAGPSRETADAGEGSVGP